MSRSLVEALIDPRVFARLTVSATAALTKSLATGKPIPIKKGNDLFLLHSDGSLTPIDHHMDDPQNDN